MRITESMSFVPKSISTTIGSERQKETSPLKTQRRDTLFIGREAQRQFQQRPLTNDNRLEQLMEQQTALQERRSELVERTLEKGEDISTIREQLETFDEQLREVELQMMKEKMAEQEAFRKQNEQPKQTVTETEDERLLQDTVALSQLKTMHQSKRYIERESRTLQAEIKMDASRGVSTQEKEEKLAALEQRLSNVSEKMTELFESDRSFETAEEPIEEES